MQNKPKLRFKEFTEDWNHKELDKISSVYDGTHQTPKYTESGIKFLSVENIKNLSASNKYISEEDFKNEFKIKPEKNDILMTRIGDIGTPALVEDNEDYAYYVSLALLKLNSEKANPKFLLQYILTNNFQHELWKRTLHIAFPKKINKGEICKCSLKLSSKPEQEKIASFLSKVDELLNEHESEVADLETQKKGLIQKLFTQQIRFKDSNGNNYPDWQEKKLSTIFTEYKAQSDTNNQYEVLTSSRQGLMPQSDYYSGDNRITDRDNIGFNVIPPNYLTYRSRSDDGFFTFNLNNIGITGIISVYYPVFTSSGNNLFIANYLNHHKNTLYKFAVGSSQKVLSYKALTDVKLLIPHKEEQEKIANLLGKMDELINEKKALLEDWKQFKKGLLQQMFV